MPITITDTTSDSQFQSTTIAQVDFLVAQTSLRKAKFQIQYLDAAGIYTIPESMNANVLIVAGNAQINSIDSNALPTPIPMPTGFSIDFPFKSHYYFYPAIEIELLGNNGKMYLSYEELYTDFYPTN